MPASVTGKTILAANTGNTFAVSLTLGSPQSGPQPDTTAIFNFYGIYSGFTIQVEGQGADGQWYPLACQDFGTLAVNQGGTAFTLGTNAYDSVKVDITGMVATRCWASAASSGTLNVSISSNYYYNAPFIVSSITSNSLSGSQTITSNSANAFDVGPSGTTNPTFQVDASTASAATGLKIKSAAAGSGMALQVISSGTNEALTIDAKAAALITLAGAASTATGVQVGSSTSAANAVLTVYSSGAGALEVGPNGTTNPTFQVNASTSSAATGLKITSAAAGSGLALAVISSGTNEALTIDAKTAGVVEIASVSTGTVYLGRGGSAATFGSLTTGALGTTQSSTPTAAQLLGGIITQTGATGAGMVTLPSGTALSAACALTPVAKDYFECLFVNVGGSETLTITGATGTTVSGTVAIGSGKTCRMQFVCTGTNAWVIYCTASA